LGHPVYIDGQRQSLTIMETNTIRSELVEQCVRAINRLIRCCTPPTPSQMLRVADEDGHARWRAYSICKTETETGFWFFSVSSFHLPNLRRFELYPANRFRGGLLRENDGGVR